ncbi:hypothetical protein Tco_1042871 [Tanacetum coccineum]|uniref:Uncharacterized protein n=1 Tax=Tanacetum coccineum TaxID=301880 RepID=A0ABQ5GKK9_9ASTR
MVAYLEKSEDNVDFAKIVDFLNASHISSKSTTWNEFGTNIASAVICLAKKQKFNFSKLIFDAVFNDEYDTPSHTKKVFANMRRQGKDFSGTVTPLFATMLIQSQAVEGEADETIYEERGDSVEKAATTATSLDAEQGSVLDLENIKNAQALEIQKLKKRVKKLESKKKSRTPQLKRRLFRVRIESSAKKSLGDLEDAPKQGRNEIDQDEGISWFQEDSETHGRYGHDIGVTTTSAPVTTAGVYVGTTEPSTPPTTTTTTLIEDEDLNIA